MQRTNDFNVDISYCEDRREVLEYVMMMQSHDMFPLINRSTRVGKTGASLLDHLRANSIKSYDGSGVVGRI